MSRISKEISCITGEYTNANGERKKRYQRIGSIINTKNGEMLKLDSIPLMEGGWNGWAYINEPKQKESKGSGFDDDSEVPF